MTQPPMRDPYDYRITPPVSGISHGFAATNGIRMHYAAAGAGPPVIFLHGFPDLWWSWRELLLDAAPHFRAVAPDMRGYNETDHIRHGYHIRDLCADITGLMDALGYSKARIVGHDWGGAVAWALAALHPGRVEKLCVMNCPHPIIFHNRVLRPSQLRRSWYMFFFQLRGLAEWSARRNLPRLVKGAFRPANGNKAAFTQTDYEVHLAHLGMEGVLACGMNYYRAAFRYQFEMKKALAAPIQCPSLLIWGEADPHLGTLLIPGTERFAPGLRVHRIPRAGHWVMREARAEVSRVLLEFMRE